MYEENSYRHLTYIKTMLNVLITDVKVAYDLNTLCENLKFNEDTRHDRYNLNQMCSSFIVFVSCGQELKKKA